MPTTHLTNRNLTVGDPSDSNSKMGALISKEHLAKVTSVFIVIPN